MKSLKIFSLCLMAIAIVGCHGKSLEKTNRIAGGEEVTIDKAPYIVQLWDPKEGFYCSGSVIRDRIVLTAAHCFDDNNYLKVKVVGGISTLAERANGITRGIVDAYMPSDYDKKTNDCDMALLVLDGDMKGPNIQKVLMSDETLKTGAQIDVFGWGLTKERGNLSNKLRKVRIPIIDHKKCKDMHMKGEITDNMMCAAAKGKDACSADSGGPATYKGKLAGIVSWGIGCARDSNPGVYTELSKVRWFVDSVLESLK